MPKLREVVERSAVTVERHVPLSRAAKDMYEQRVGSIVVLDDDGALVGILTERDVLRACASGVDTHAATVGNWMTPEPVTASADAEAAAALQTMIDRGFRHLPVLGEGGIIGVVSMRTLSRSLQAARMG